ncbi:MAG: hypothetical protein L6Q78_15890 [Bacteroidia bacterium]|nr:hypothetical protein [Bacteroidia bacterium]
MVGKGIGPALDKLDYEINAGGWIRITRADSVLYFCAAKKKAMNLFLSTPLE